MAGYTPKDIKKYATEVHVVVGKFKNYYDKLVSNYENMAALFANGGDMWKRIIELQNLYDDTWRLVQNNFGVISDRLNLWADKTIESERLFGLDVDSLLQELSVIKEDLGSIGVNGVIEGGHIER